MRVLIAKDDGFYRGSFVARGSTFEFFGEKLPKWAVEQGGNMPAQRSEAHPDTKPKAARDAAKGKASGAADQAA